MSERKSAYEIAPASMTRTPFVLSHPLCKVKAGDSGKFSRTTDFGEGNKIVRINCVDKELLDYFILRHVYPVMEKAASCYVRQRDVLLAFLPIFTHLAPRDTDAAMLKKYEGESADSAQAATQLEVHAHAPGADCQVLDVRAYFEAEDVEDFQARTVLICNLTHGKFLWEPLRAEGSVLFQLAAHSCCAGVANMSRGRYEPIYMVVLADGNYAFAVLHMEGYLSVDSMCRITEDSFGRFLEQLREKWCQENPGGEYVELSKSEKQARLSYYQERINKSRVRMKEEGMDDTIPPDRRLLVGEVRVYPAERGWSRFPHDSGMRFTLDDYIFVSGMLRVLYGDRVCKWTKETLQALEDAHDKMLEARATNLVLQ